MHLTAVTSSLDMAIEFLRCPEVEVIQLGGLLRRSSSSVVGVYAERILQDFYFNTLFLGVDGIELDFGFSITNIAEATLNQKKSFSKNEKIGISGMRIILESDINHQTERQYKPGYKLSEITSSLKIAEIKSVFDLKNIVNQELKASSSLKELRDNLYRQGWAMKVQYKKEFLPNHINQVQDIWLKRVATTTSSQHKDGLFYNKYAGFSLSAIGGNFKNIEKLINATAQSSVFPASSTNENVLEIALETVEEILKPNYVSQAEGEWWKKKKKFKR